MFPTSNNHQILHNARQRELEAAAENYRRISSLAKKNRISSLRQLIGSMLIELGQKVAQENQQDTRLVLSAQK